MAEKVFRTYDEQLNILSDRGIVFCDKRARKKAKNIIQREGYYKLINGYKAPFLDRSFDTETFLEGCTVDEIFALYSFDRDIREIFLRHILHVETNIKSLIAYTISEKYGHENYLLYKNFNTDKSKANQEISTVISDLQSTIAKNHGDPCIKHYLQNYGYVPLWVLNNVLTLGNVSRLFSIMKVEDRQSVSRIFKVQDKSMESFLHTLSIIRNFCAHGNRLYCIRTKRPLLDTPIHKNLNIQKTEGGEYSFGKRDLFSGVIALRYFLSAREFIRFESELNGAINKLTSKLHVISIDSILSAMGFPENWKEIKVKGIKTERAEGNDTAEAFE